QPLRWRAPARLAGHAAGAKQPLPAARRADLGAGHRPPGRRARPGPSPQPAAGPERHRGAARHQYGRALLRPPDRPAQRPSAAGRQPGRADDRQQSGGHLRPAHAGAQPSARPATHRRGGLMRWLFCALALLAGLARAETHPPRIAVIDWGLTETLLGLGVTPIAVAQTEGYRRWVMQPELPASVV